MIYNSNPKEFVIINVKITQIIEGSNYDNLFKTDNKKSITLI
jgi:hypothetical protein